VNSAAPPAPPPPAPRAEGWRFAPRRLATRIVIVFGALLLAVQAAGFLAVNEGVERNARQLLAENLRVGAGVWQATLEQRAEKLRFAAGVLAADFGFRAALASRDDPTIASALANSGERAGAGLTALLDPAFAPAVLGEGSDPALGGALAALAPKLRAGGAPLALVGGRPYQFVVVPVRAPVVVGHVVLAFEIDGGMLDGVRALAGLHLALFAQAEPGVGRDAQRIVATTLPPAAAADLRRARAAAVSANLELAGEPHVSREVGHGAASGLSSVLMLSVAEALRPYRQVQVLLAAITLAGVVLFAAGGAWTARRVTTPLSDIASATRRFGRGELGVRLHHTDRHDEVGHLARAFEQMRVNLGVKQAEVHALAYFDPLTGLPNRAAFRQAVQAVIDRAEGGAAGPHAVVMLDLDRFKHVNDVLGYAFGDRLLKAVAQRLQAGRLREDDVVARLSGDEFALFLPGRTAAEAMQVVQRVAASFELPLALDEQTVDIAAGFGIAGCPEHGADADTLLSRAEVAMVAAKRRTEKALVYHAGIDSGSAETLSLLSELRRALEGGELRLFLQPKVAVASGELVGAEALVRWQHPTRGMVPPMQFIPFAEQTGFVRRLTLWIFEAAAAEHAALAAIGVARVSVNLSTRDLLDQDLPARLAVILARHGAPAEAFCLEITESAIMDEPQRAEATLNALAAMGFKLSIDDFGTGYSSLAYLKRLPVQELKIDKGFVMAMERSAGDATIVRSTIDLAHNLGLVVVAEGVESAAILERLAELRCDEAQGYHIARPLPAAEVAAFAQRYNGARAATRAAEPAAA
jgi:diguanylate cyclase (GGDEF)-like protein